MPGCATNVPKNLLQRQNLNSGPLLWLVYRFCPQTGLGSLHMAEPAGPCQATLCLPSSVPLLLEPTSSPARWWSPRTSRSGSLGTAASEMTFVHKLQSPRHSPPPAPPSPSHSLTSIHVNSVPGLLLLFRVMPRHVWLADTSFCTYH